MMAPFCRKSFTTVASKGEVKFLSVAEAAVVRKESVFVSALVVQMLSLRAMRRLCRGLEVVSVELSIDERGRMQWGDFVRAHGY